MNNSRNDFAKKSLEKSKGFNDDPLIKFVILWIGLNALYDDPAYGVREAEKVNNFFQQNERVIREIIHKREKELQEMQNIIQEYPIQHDRINQFLQTKRSIFDYTHPDSV